MKYNTKYNFTFTAEKIRKLRKNNPKTKSQEAFIDVLKEQYGFTISRNTISRIENGDETAFSLDFLLCVSDLFNCDIGYLLGEYEEATAAANKICEITGLTEKAVNNLRKYSATDCNQFVHMTINEDSESVFRAYKSIFEIIDELISSGDMYNLAKLLYELEYNSYEYLEQIEIRKNVHQSLYGKSDNRSEAEKNGELVHSKKEIDQMRERIDLDKYRLNEFIVHLLDRYDQREQVKNNGNNNPTNK